MFLSAMQWCCVWYFDSLEQLDIRAGLSLKLLLHLDSDKTSLHLVI